MNKYAGLLIGMLMAGSVLACAQLTLTGSGDLVTEEVALSDFDQVDISNSFRVDIQQGDRFSVIVRLDDNLLEHLQVTKQGSTLKIGLDPGSSFSMRNATLEAEVTMPALTGVSASGSSQANITGFSSGEPFQAALSGSSSLRGDIQAGETRFDLSGSSNVELSGSGQNLTIHASGSSDLDLAEFAVADASISLSGASTVTVNASGRLDVDASGSSDVYYLGDPTLGATNLSGGSEVKPK